MKVGDPVMVRMPDFREGVIRRIVPVEYVGGRVMEWYMVSDGKTWRWLTKDVLTVKGKKDDGPKHLPV